MSRIVTEALDNADTADLGEATAPTPEPEDNTAATAQPEGGLSIAKPSTFNLDKFKSKRGAAIANVGTLLTALPILRISEANDFVRLHPDEANYWSDEICFVNVPVKGQKRDTLHLIDEELAMRYLPTKRIQRFRLALATKPYDVFFFCRVPTQNIDNSWVSSNVMACMNAKERWVMVTSRKDEGVESYKVDFARSEKAFPTTKWPEQSLVELIETSFVGRQIDRNDHPGLLRLVGAAQSIS